MPYRVLLVEDHRVIRHMVRALFEHEGFEVFEAENGAEGVRRATELDPNLVVMDLSMPVMNGLEAARTLKTKIPDLPLLMFTNVLAPNLEEEALSAGFKAVVSKTEPTGNLLIQAKDLISHGRMHSERGSHP
jgi:CheY-like chemotaxis protein